MFIDKLLVAISLITILNTNLKSSYMLNDIIKLLFCDSQFTHIKTLMVLII